MQYEFSDRKSKTLRVVLSSQERALVNDALNHYLVFAEKPDPDLIDERDLRVFRDAFMGNLVIKRTTLTGFREGYMVILREALRSYEPFVEGDVADTYRELILDLGASAAALAAARDSVDGISLPLDQIEAQVTDFHIPDDLSAELTE